MKNKYFKNILFTLACGSLLSLSSCKDYLDVENPSTVSQEATFNSLSYSSSAVTAVYNRLMGDDGYGSRISTLYPNGGEDFRISGDYNGQDRRGISHYGVDVNNSDIKNPFLQLYNGIERANICIKYIPTSPLYTSGTAAEQAAMRKLYGEVLTLRAQFYYELIRNWGDVPAQFEPSADIPDLYLPKTDRDVIYDRLLEDLKVASDLVPWRTESGDPSTRVTKAAVKGLRARIALARGGYSLRRESQMMERKPDYRDFYQIARDETRDIIQSGQHSLNPVYENVFRSLHTGNRQDSNNELIFEAGAFGGGARTDSKLGYSNGLRINATSSFGQANGQLEAIPTYFYEFDQNNDVRRDVTIAYFEVDASNNKLLTTSIIMRDGKFRKYWTGIAGTNQTLGINWPLLRYADVLLMFAEAENELNGSPSAEAISAYEQVRKRAFVGNENKIGATPTSKDGFFNAIVQERLLEFGGEGIRKYDLIRWNLLAPKIQETREKLQAMVNGTGQYANVPRYIYFKPSPLLNSPTVPQEIASFDFYSAEFPDGKAPVNKVFYEPGLNTSTAPAGYTTRNWRAAVTQDHVNGAVRGFASQFQANRKELFPIHADIINQNYNLTQDYGY